MLTTDATTYPAGHATGVLDDAVRSNQYRHIQYHAGGRELCVQGADPDECTNVADDPPCAGVVATLSSHVPA